MLGLVATDVVHVPFFAPGCLSPIAALERHEQLRPSSFRGALAVTDDITPANTQRYLEGFVPKPEHIVLQPAATHCDDAETMTDRDRCLPHLFMSSFNGTVYRASVHADGAIDASSLREVVYAGPGPVLGFTLDGDGLYICNAVQGLLNWTPQSGLRVVSNRVTASGAALAFVNSAAITSDRASVYFTTSTDLFPQQTPSGFSTMRAAQLAGFLGRKSGRLLRFDAANGVTEEVLRDLWFPNGIALGERDDFLVFAETFPLRVWKLWLRGDKAGRLEVLIENLPGFPDNIAAVNGGASFYIGLVARPSPLVESRLFLNRMVRALMARAPQWVVEMVTKKVAGGIHVSSQGHVLGVIADPTGRVASSTPSGVLLPGKLLFMGNLANDYIAVSRLSR